MTKAYMESTIRISTTPKELRRLADKMEKRYEELRPGDSTFIAILAYLEDRTMIALHADQEGIERDKKDSQKQ